MRVPSLYPIWLFCSSVSVAGEHHYEFQVETRHYCIDDLLDHNGEPVAPALPSVSDLEEDGWTFLQMNCEGYICEDVWIKKSMVEPSVATGVHLTGIYASNIMPDMWTIYLRHDDGTPLRIVATNERHGGTVHQEILFTKFKKRAGTLSMMEVRERMFGVYLINDDVNSFAHAEVEKLSGHTHHFKEQLFAGMVPVASRIPPVVSDWIPQAHFDTMGAIPYDVVEPGSAAASYFFATSTRRSLVEMFDFEYPKSCLKRGQSDKYCLSVVANKSVSNEQFELDTEIRMADVHDRSRSAEFSLVAVLGSKPHSELALDFSLKARGCAVVWQAGIKSQSNCNSLPCS
ncbi:hypothetical protein FOZ60_016809 [Perkinsus olseni]|uniref:Uncharacterized protein n=1 Tax=Perkinsus olseni TaxID=32597 RepID=A0A7J6P4R7_PEROL|nr:hypothetical protein FOZ60_016809 [Perkinsus olseni]